MQWDKKLRCVTRSKRISSGSKFQLIVKIFTFGPSDEIYSQEINVQLSHVTSCVKHSLFKEILQSKTIFWHVVSRLLYSEWLATSAKITMQNWNVDKTREHICKTQQFLFKQRLKLCRCLKMSCILCFGRRNPPQKYTSPQFSIFLFTAWSLVEIFTKMGKECKLFWRKNNTSCHVCSEWVLSDNPTSCSGGGKPSLPTLTTLTSFCLNTCCSSFPTYSSFLLYTFLLVLNCFGNLFKSRLLLFLFYCF